MSPSWYAGDLRFMNNEILRVETIASRVNGPSNSYYKNYWFVGVDKKKIHFNLLEELKGLNPVHVRAFDDSIYIVESKDKNSNKPVYRIIRFNPLQRTYKTLLTISDSHFGRNISHGPVDERGRDVWKMSDDHLIVFFSSYDDQEGWVGFRLEVAADTAKIVKAERPRQMTLISNTTDFVRDFSDSNRLQIKTPSGKTVIYTGLYGKASWLSLEAFPGGFVGIEADWDKYRHYLLDLDGNLMQILDPRLVKAEYYEGGFIGASNVRLNSGELLIYRVIYSPELLVAQAHRKLEALVDVSNSKICSEYLK